MGETDNCKLVLVCLNHIETIHVLLSVLESLETPPLPPVDPVLSGREEAANTTYYKKITQNHEE